MKNTDKGETCQNNEILGSFDENRELENRCFVDKDVHMEILIIAIKRFPKV